MNNFTGEKIEMQKAGLLYEVDLWVRPASLFGRQGS